MVLNAANAVTLTNNAISIQDTNDLEREVGITEAAIRNAATRQLSYIKYNATIVGNPVDDPLNTQALSSLQASYRDVWLNNGFTVDRDEDSGYWLISWEATGAENIVNVYMLYTTLTPGAIETQTITAITTYLNGLDPVVRVKTVLVEPTGSGGDVDETEFGGTASTFYQYVIVTHQETFATDHSSGILTALVAAGLGYDNSPGTDNIEVYKVI